MLRAALKGGVGGAALTSEEDRVLRAAFGRYGGSQEARQAAAAVVRRYQQLGAGHWFLCDCRSGAERPPALVLVSQTHIRRHCDARWPVPCDACDFHREPAEQCVITASHSSAAAARPLRLARRLEASPTPLDRRLVTTTHNTGRSGLARLLMRLLADSGVQEIGPVWRPPPLVD